IMAPDVRLHRPPMERRGVAGRLPVRAVTDILHVGRLAPGPATRRRVPGERDTWLAPVPATLDRDVAMRPGGVWLVRLLADLDPDTPAYVVAQTAAAIKSPDKPGMAIVGPWPLADEKAAKGPVFWVWPLPLTAKDPGKAAGVDRRMPMLSFPIHDALIVHRWPLAIRDLSLRPVAPEPPLWWARPEREIPIRPAMWRAQVWLVTFAPAADGRAAAMLWAGDAGHRLQDKHDAAVLAVVSGRRSEDRAAATFAVLAGRRPSEYDAARLPLFAGRRFPTEHDALRFVLRTLRRVTDHGATTLARILARRPTDHGAARLLAPRSGTRRPRSDRGAVFRPVIQADMAERQAVWSLVAGWPLLAHVGARDALAVMPVDLAVLAAVPAVVLAPPVPIDAKAPKPGATVALALAGRDPDRGAVVAPALAMAAHDPSKPAVVAATLVLLSYPIHDALLVRPWPLAGLDAATPAVIAPAGPVVTTESALHGRQGAHLRTGGEGRREPVVQGAAVFDQLPPGQRWPTVHGAVKAPAIPPPGRRAPTEHGAVRLHV